MGFESTGHLTPTSYIRQHQRNKCHAKILHTSVTLRKHVRMVPADASKPKHAPLEGQIGLTFAHLSLEPWKLSLSAPLSRRQPTAGPTGRPEGVEAYYAPNGAPVPHIQPTCTNRVWISRPKAGLAQKETALRRTESASSRAKTDQNKKQKNGRGGPRPTC